jgi:hypothetical protein
MTFPGRDSLLKVSWSLLATRAFVVWCFSVYVLVTLSSLDRRLQGDDHAIIWTSTLIRFGQLPNRDFHEGGYPLQVLLSYLGQWATGFRPIGEIAVTVTMRLVGLISTYLVARRITGYRLPALLIVLPVAMISVRGGLYGAEKAMIYPLAAYVAYRYFERPRPPWELCAVTAIAFLLRHDHGVYVGVPLALAVLLSRQSLVPFVLGVLVLLLPWLAWVQVHEGLVAYFIDRLEFARLAGIAVARPGFGIPPGTPFDVRNASWLMWQLAVITIAVAFVVAVWRRDRLFIVLSVLGGLAAGGLMRGLGLYPEVMTLWIPLGVWLITLARHPVGRVAGAAWVAAVAAFVLTISEPRARLWHFVLEEGGATRRARSAIARHSAVPIIDNYAPADVTDERMIVRYFYRCLDPGERIWDASQWFPLPYYTEHPLFEGPNWRIGIRRSHDAEMAASLRSGPLPPVIVVEHESDPYNAFKYYPVIQALVREKYEPLTSPAMDDFRKNIDEISLLRDRSRQPTGRYAPLDLPCFARAAAGATDLR